MSIEPRVYVTNDKKIPASMSGDAGKVLVVNSAEDAYEHGQALTGKVTGEIFMWPTNIPPTGALMCNGAEYDTAQYPNLSAVLGESSAGKFNVPYILFPKNSFGAGTLTQEAEGVGTHGHTTEDGSEHQHGVIINSVAAHNHQSRGSDNSHGLTSGNDVSCPTTAWASTTSAGAHGHVVGSNQDGLTEPAEGGGNVIEDHVGITQPACTLLNFCIKT